MSDKHWRLWAALIAIAAWSGLLLQLTLVTAREGSITVALWRMAIFFTVISNLTTAIVYSCIALGLVRFRHPLLIAGLALTMLLVGAVFELMLRSQLHLAGWRILSNMLEHDIVPFLAVTNWVILAEKGHLRARDPWIIALFPIAYLAYVLTRAHIEGFYPYPFLNIPKIGWAAALRNIAGISVAFLVGAYLLVAIDRWLGRPKLSTE